MRFAPDTSAATTGRLNLFRLGRLGLPTSDLKWTSAAGIGALVTSAALLPALLGASPYNLTSLYFVVAMGILCVGLNVSFGFAGQLFLGITAPFGLSAYVVAYLANTYVPAQSLPVMCVEGVVVSVLLTLVMALQALRVSGFYLGMVTLFVAVILPQAVSNIRALGATQGISLVANATFVQHPSGVLLYEVGLAMLMSIATLTSMVQRSATGRRFYAIKSNDVLAQSVGISPYRTKLLAFLLGAVASGIAAAYYVYSLQFIGPDSVAPTLFISIFAGLVIGGAGSVWGAILGVGIVTGLNQFLFSLNQYEGIVFGALIALVAVLFPEGLAGLVRRAVRWIGGERRAVPRAVRSALARGEDRVEARCTATPEGAETASGLGGARRRDEKLLTVRHVSRSFGGVLAVSGVTLELRPGEVHGLVGTNGSGKTTLLNLVCGYYSLDAGEIWLGKQRLDIRSPAAITRAGVARTFQTPQLMSANSIYENVKVAAEQARAKSRPRLAVRRHERARGREEVEHRVLSALAGVDLAPFNVAGYQEACGGVAGAKPHGTQRLVEIARALALDPAVLLLDEPAAGSSEAEMEVLISLLRSVRLSGLGVLLVEHNLPVVLKVADRVTVMHQGSVIASGTPAEIQANSNVEQVYLGY